jgi:hypothetical protein
MMKLRLLASLFLLTFFLAQVHAQNDAELDSVRNKIGSHIQSKMPGWRHRPSEPIQGSKGVLVDYWVSTNRIVKISVVRYASPQEAKALLQQFMMYESQKQELKGLGEAAYAWGYGLSKVVFLRGKFLVYLSTYAEVDSDPDARSLSPSARGERERSEMKRLSQEFAKHMVTAVDQP